MQPKYIAVCSHKMQNNKKREFRGKVARQSITNYAPHFEEEEETY